MDLITTLTGLLPAAILISALLGALLSSMLLRSYRRGVIRSMNHGRETGDTAQSAAATAEPCRQSVVLDPDNQPPRHRGYEGSPGNHLRLPST